MTNYNEFKSQVLGKGFDIDGAYGYQCWDGYAQYCKYLSVPFANCTQSGYVKDIWNLRKSNGTLNYFDEVEIMQPGDIAVFKEVAGWTPVSHIAIFDSDIDGVYGNFLGQNQGGTTGANGGAVFNIVRLPYSATFDTAFRPKKKQPAPTLQPQGGNKLSVPTKNVNGDLYSGLITDTDPNIMNADSNRTKIDMVILHHNAGTSDEGARRTWYVSTGVGTSAHYQVTPNKIWGCVGENFVAYHAGNYGVNQRSIGIEHLNSTGAPNWEVAEATRVNSARLVRDICERYGIPIDRAHIKGHGEIVPTGCPGGLNVDRIVEMARNLGQEEEKPTASVVLRNIDQKALTYDVVLTNIQAPNGVKAVTFPTWTNDKGQDDLVWHNATRQANGEWVYKVKASEHGNQKGIYITHAYITTNSGKQFGVGGVDLYLNGVEPVGTMKVTNINIDEGYFDVVATGVNNPNGVKSVSFPTWTEASGQDDIKWYKATQQKDGSWTQRVYFKDHKGELGKYIIHGYVVQKNDQLAGFGGIDVTVEKPRPEPEKPSQMEEIVVVTKSDAKIKHVIVSAEEFEKLNKK